ncbi:MAG: hypothetical protein U0871_16310 [Gemmataceae bacterium]
MRTHGLLLCFVLIAAGAAVHGAATHRWETVTPSDGVAGRLHAHVLRLGDLAAEEIPNDLPLKEKSIATSRRYTSPSGNFWTVVSVITGPPGAVATHTPDVCYPSSGYKTVRGPIRETVDLPGGGTATYYVADFEKATATRTERQRVRWAWSVDGSWGAPDRPRFQFLRFSDLAKLYIVTSTPDDPVGSGEDSPAVRQMVAATFAQYAGLFAGR